MKKLIMLFLVVLCISSCGGGGGGGGGSSQDPAPGAVTMTFATISSTGFSFGWIEPDNTDLASIRIAYKGPSDTAFNTLTVLDAVDPALVPDRSNNWISPGGFVSLTIDARYEITITAIDTGNNETTVSFKLTNAGNQNNYYFIYTAADLNALRGSVAGYEDWDASANGFVLMDDIDLAAYSSGEGWVPIGDNTGSFGKTFEGNGHTISGLVINRPDADYQGLFGYLGGPGIINNLTVQGGVNGRSHVGGLVGTSEGVISNCVSGVAVTGNTGGEYENIGGLVGDNAGGSVSDSSATGAVHGIYSVGGLIGLNDGGTVDNCHATGAVTSTFDRAGGLVGASGGPITDSYATGTVVSSNNNAGGLVGAIIMGTIDNCYSTGTVTCPNAAGGLVGLLYGEINQSYSTGNVTGGAESTDTGGLVGYMDNGAVSDSYASGTVSGTLNTGGLIDNMTAGTISSCHATGAVTGNDDYLGGLIGYVAWATITGSYTTGVVTGSTSESDNVGGFVGYINGGAITGSYATGSVTGDDYIGGLIGGNNEGEITGYHTIGAVTGQERVGGLIGNNTGGQINSGSYSEGTVSGILYVGGLIGYLGSGTITGSHSHCTVTGYRHVGGLAGLNTSLISLSYATGSSTATAGGDTDYVGGLVGSCDSGIITNCYARGSAIGYGGLGGLVGYMNNSTISYCYSTGAVTGTGSFRGGLVGYFGSGSAPSFCYYDKDISGLEDTTGTPTSTVNMKLQTTFTGWDFVSDSNGSNDYWSIDNTGAINNGYPYLTTNH